ncbi:Methyltransferase domain-containing protein [Lentzea albidocapillata subsp. violacea]|uniref:Methyltransferase domain-containing protein n=1 Tax=Lentzea albidocapillata subsp. violacea TaxID=128104 RepID=A0A1G9U4H6_9PSEU|nr:class I SAM-dependent methyltransferase [Lentzea albidocapillata]SDM54485.1 Methyltransferase domain-containing protein [Lentzea albidocapillata subsp. violacea]
MLSDDRRLQAANPTGWFEDLYAEAETGTASVPWDIPNPQPHLVEWASGVDGTGQRALVVGCGYGRDSEFLASLGFEVTAFDISPTAVAAVQKRYPSSPVSYVVADLLDPPAEWHRAFDLVVENMTVQALPVALHAEATGRVSSLTGSTLLVLAVARDEGPEPDGPPWPLTPAEIEAFAGDGLTPRSVRRDNGRWVAEFGRQLAMN